MAVTAPSKTISAFLPAFLVATAAVWLFVGQSDSVHASTVVLSNLSASTDGPDSVDSTQKICQLFTTGTSPYGWYLQSVKFPVTQLLAGTSFAVQIFDAVGSATDSKPGTLLGSLSGPDAPTTGVQTYTASGAGLALSASANYWLVWGTQTGNYYVDYTVNPATTGDWTIPTTGINWGYLSNPGSVWDPYSGTPFKFEITATPQAVPEPATYAMALAGVACGGYSLFRRRKQA